MKEKLIYTILNFSCEKESINAKIKFDSSHIIFKGHFPGNPIVPGVIQVQIIKELVEKGLSKKLILNKSKNIKFLNFISPLKNREVDVSVNYKASENNMIKASAVITSQEVIFLKFSGEYSFL